MMRLRHGSTAIRLAMTAAILLSGPAPAETRNKVVATGAVYCATKHAVRAIAEGLRQEVKDDNIRVNTISPDAVRTELTVKTSVSNPPEDRRLTRIDWTALKADRRRPSFDSRAVV